MEDQGKKQFYREAVETAVLAGDILLESGAEIFRVEETIDRISRAYGVESEESFVLSSGILTTAGNRSGEFFARVKHIPLTAARLDRVAAVNQLSREIVQGRWTVEEAHARLLEIRSTKPKPSWARILASAVGSGCFSFLFGGDLADSLVAAAAGALLYLYLLYFASGRLSKIITNILGSALVTAFSVLLYQFGVGHHLNQMVIGSIIPLLPGVAFTSAIRDIVDEDYIAGSVRMLDALLVTFCIALGVGVVIALYHQMTGGALL